MLLLSLMGVKVISRAAGIPLAAAAAAVPFSVKTRPLLAAAAAAAAAALFDLFLLVVFGMVPVLEDEEAGSFPPLAEEEDP